MRPNEFRESAGASFAQSRGKTRLPGTRVVYPDDLPRPAQTIWWTNPTAIFRLGGWPPFKRDNPPSKLYREFEILSTFVVYVNDEYVIGWEKVVYFIHDIIGDVHRVEYYNDLNGLYYVAHIPDATPAGSYSPSFVTWEKPDKTPRYGIIQDGGSPWEIVDQTDTYTKWKNTTPTPTGYDNVDFTLNNTKTEWFLRSAVGISTAEDQAKSICSGMPIRGVIGLRGSTPSAIAYYSLELGDHPYGYSHCSTYKRAYERTPGGVALVDRVFDWRYGAGWYCVWGPTDPYPLIPCTYSQAVVECYASKIRVAATDPQVYRRQYRVVRTNDGWTTDEPHAAMDDWTFPNGYEVAITNHEVSCGKLKLTGVNDIGPCELVPPYNGEPRSCLGVIELLPEETDVVYGHVDLSGEPCT